MRMCGLSLVGTDYAVGDGIQPPLKAGNDRLPPLIFSAVGSLARISASPGDDEDSLESDQACSLSSPGSQTSLFDEEDGCCWRTCPDFYLPKAAEISPSWLRVLQGG